MIRTFVIVIFWPPLSILIVLPPLILWTLVTGNPERMYWSAMGAVGIIDRIGGIRVRVDGLENIPSGACLFACNHVSEYLTRWLWFPQGFRGVFQFS